MRIWRKSTWVQGIIGSQRTLRPFGPEANAEDAPPVFYNIMPTRLAGVEDRIGVLTPTDTEL